MNKNKIFSKLLIMFLVFSIFTVGTTTAYAKTVYYPVSGTASESCSNATHGKVLTYNLPAGTLKVSYSAVTNNVLQLRFYQNRNLIGGYNTATLYNTPTSNSTTITLPVSGTYYVCVYTQNGQTGNFTYAYDLYKE